MLFIVVIIFIALHIPFTALIFIRNKLLNSLVMDQIDGWFYILWYTSHYLLYLNAAVNPIIYGLTNDNFRRAYHQTPLLPQRIRFWSTTLTKYWKHKNHNEVRMDFFYFCAAANARATALTPTQTRTQFSLTRTRTGAFRHRLCNCEIFFFHFSHVLFHRLGCADHQDTGNWWTTNRLPTNTVVISKSNVSGQL